MQKTIKYTLATLVVSLVATAILPTTGSLASEGGNILNIPMDRQDYSLSCEAASLKMALTYKGFAVAEPQILAIFGIDDSPRRNNIWGDPDQVFVGNVRGKQNRNGYGVHWNPVARAAQVFLPNSVAFSGWSSTQIASELTQGNPVIIWGTTGKARRDSWRTPEGKIVQAWVGEHTYVVIGYTGSPENPSSFILNDPLGRRLTWSAQKLNANMSAFGNSGVVVR